MLELLMLRQISILRDTNTPWRCHNAELLASTYTSAPLTFFFFFHLKKNTAHCTVTSSYVRNWSRPHCWKENGVHHNRCRVCPLILFYFMVCVYSHDWTNKPSKQPFMTPRGNLLSISTCAIGSVAVVMTVGHSPIGKLLRDIPLSQGVFA